MELGGALVFSVGIGSLLFVPVFKAVTGLPQYLGMLFGLGVLWVLTDAIHDEDFESQKLKVPQALSRIDTQSALFFLGILLSVGSLEAAGILKELANYLDSHIPSIELIAGSIGLASAVIDNVPLVAATMGMYDKSVFPIDSELWQLIAYCAGTGGSILIIGYVAGVAFMGMEKDDFFWYLRKVIVRDFVGKSIFAQFRAHSSPLYALCFDPSASLLVTAYVHGHNLNVLCIMTSLGRNGSSAAGSDENASYVHLYKLYRGLTNVVIK